MFSQKFTLELYNSPSPEQVLSPFSVKYLGWSTLVLCHTKLKSDELGFLKIKQMEEYFNIIWYILGTPNYNSKINVKINKLYPVFAKLHHNLLIVLHILDSGESGFGANPNICT